MEALKEDLEAVIHKVDEKRYVYFHGCWVSSLKSGESWDCRGDFIPQGPVIQWNLRIMDTFRTQHFVLCREVVLFWRLFCIEYVY